jgi:hypothetical protein
MVEGERMIRYCKNCALFVQAKVDRRYDEVCPVCDWVLFFTLRQRHFFLEHFTSRHHTGYSAAVRRGYLMSRSGESGTVVDAWEYGLSLDFFGPAPSILAYEWDELEIEHLLPNDQPELGLDRVLTPTLEQIQIGDRIMLRNGKTYRLNRRIKTRDGNKKLGIAGIDILGAENIGAKNIYTIVDWLPKSEMDALTELNKETHAV